MERDTAWQQTTETSGGSRARRGGDDDAAPAPLQLMVAPGVGTTSLAALMSAGGNQGMVQLTGAGGGDGPSVHAAAERGTRGGGGGMPYGGQIQQSFGHHDVGAVRAHVGGPAREACDAMGAEAYASGDAVAFKGQPDLHTAAHEAAHIVQQRAGVSLKGGVGQVGDAYEQHADRVADAVVQGKSAEGLLDQMAGGGKQGRVQRRAVQRRGQPAMPAVNLDLSGIWGKAGSVAASGGVQKATWSCDTPEFPLWGPFNCKLLFNGNVALQAGAKVQRGGDTEMKASIGGSAGVGISFGVGQGKVARLALNAQMTAGLTGVEWTWERSKGRSKHTIALPSCTFSGEITASLEGDLWPFPWGATLLSAWIVKTQPMTWDSDHGVTFDSKKVVWNTELLKALQERFDPQGKPRKALYEAELIKLASFTKDAPSAQKLVLACDGALNKKALTLQDVQPILGRNNVRDTIAHHKKVVLPKASHAGLRNLIIGMKASSIGSR